MANPKRRGGGGWLVSGGFASVSPKPDWSPIIRTNDGRNRSLKRMSPFIQSSVQLPEVFMSLGTARYFFLFFRWFDLNFRRFCFRCFLRFLPALPVFFLFTGTTFTWIWTLQTRSTECYSSIHKFQIIYISFSVAYFFMYFYWVSPFYSHLFQLKKNPGLTWYWFGKIIFGRYKSLGNISRVGCSNCPSCVICSRLHLSDSSWSIEIKLLFVRNTL